MTLAVDMKAFALFYLLFGVGLAIQFERLSTSSHRSLLMYRRLIVMLAIGLLHFCLIGNGDILTEYAVAGLLILPFLQDPRWFLATGALVCLVLYVAMQVFPPAGLFPSFPAIQRNVAKANQTYATGSLAEVIAFRLFNNSVDCPPAHLRLPTNRRAASAWRSSGGLGY